MSPLVDRKVVSSRPERQGKHFNAVHTRHKFLNYGSFFSKSCLVQKSFGISYKVQSIILDITKRFYSKYCSVSIQVSTVHIQRTVSEEAMRLADITFDQSQKIRSFEIVDTDNWTRQSWQKWVVCKMQCRGFLLIALHL